MLKMIGRRLALGVVATLMAATAASITLIAASFCLYAFLLTWFTRPAVSGLTALAFAVVAGLIGLIAAVMLRSVKAPKPKFDRDTARLALETAGAVLVVAADVALSRRRK